MAFSGKKTSFVCGVVCVVSGITTVTADPLQNLGSILDAAKNMDGVKDVTVEIDKNGKRGSFDCHGHNARVAGNNNVVSFDNCGTVSVPGNENAVTVNSPRKLVVHGNDNKLLWSGTEKPDVTSPGNHNVINQKKDK